MSFKASISDVVIANEALAMLPADPITSLTEQSLEARECSRFYKTVVAEMLEEHHWGLATVRQSLAVIANDRADQWRYAYAKPNDMAYPVKALPQVGGAYTGWFYRDGVFWSRTGQKMFMAVGSTIYSNIEAAVLEYTSFDITEANFTFLFKKVVVIELASRICQPITKNASRQQVLMQSSEGYRQRAIANDLNVNQPTYGDRPTESEIVRQGGVSADWAGSGYAIDPVALPSNTGY